LPVFDPARCAVLLVAGDEAGNWKSRYTNIPLADQRYDEHLAKPSTVPADVTSWPTSTARP
jgi:hypothetical protein